MKVTCSFGSKIFLLRLSERLAHPSRLCYGCTSLPTVSPPNDLKLTEFHLHIELKTVPFSFHVDVRSDLSIFCDDFLEKCIF